MTEPAPRLHWSTLWGVAGFVLLLSQAIYRLTPLALEPIEAGTLEPWHWAIWIGWVAFSVYSEAYKGFYLSAAPRLVARAFHLCRDRDPLRRALAPLFCMGLFGATRKRLIVSWCLYVGIVIVVILVRQLAQPWRGIIDAGVVIALALGTLAVLFFFARALNGHPMPVASDVPPPPGEEAQEDQQ